MDRQTKMELDYFLLESNFDFQIGKRFTWALLELFIRNSIMKKMADWFKHDEFDPEAGFILSYCSADIQREVDHMISAFMEAWCK